MGRTLKYAACVLACLFPLGLLLRADAPPRSSGAWAAAGSMMQARAGAAATLLLLPDCRVLIAGGDDGTGPSASAELYDPSIDSFTGAAPMPVARTRHVAVLLQDGRVLVAGGIGPDGGVLRRADTYDPANDAWTPVGDMVEARIAPTASLLSDGRVLIAGGDNPDGVRDSLEIFDAAANSFTAAGTLSSARKDHAAAVLPDGRVLLAGGSDGAGALSSTDLFNPSDNTASRGADLLSLRMGASATTLLNGTVLVAGGHDGSGDLASAEIYDPTSNTFSLTSGALETPRRDHLAFLLPDNNNVLIVGGTFNGAALSSAELFASWNDSFMWTEPMGAARSGAAGSVMHTEGSLLVAGGSDLASAELYGFATIQTDKGDYAPGETVTITGKGWQPGETVSLLLQEVPKTHDDRTLSVTADETGAIFNNEFQPESHDVGVRFYVIATGAQAQAQTTFTDNHIIVLSSTSDTTGGSPATSLTFAHTVAANANRLLIVGVSIKNGSSQVVSGITYDGTPLAPVGSQSNLTNARMEMWGLVNPNTGLHNVVVTMSAAAKFVAGAISFGGVNQTTPLGLLFSNTGSASPAQVTVTGVGPHDLVVDTIGVTSTSITVGAGQTSRWNAATSGSNSVRGGGSTEPGPATPGNVTMSWTFSGTNQWAIGAVAVKPQFVCGDGTVDPGEQCDDGAANGTQASCCTTSCTFKPSGTACTDDGNTCTTDACNGTSSTCQHSSLPADGTSCDDGNACTTNDTCSGGTCVGGAPPNCDDGNVCTTDSCNSASGCVNTNNTNSCDDGNACTTNDTCVAGSCLGAVPVVCDDGDACNGRETCDSATGCVAGTPLACDDANACNGTETCNSVTGCVAGTPLVCDDGNACNGTETCNSATGCVPGTAPVCDDGNACNGTETCNPVTGCVAGIPLVCNDGNACNGTETCDSARGCVAGTPLACDDGNACNGTESCSAATGCVLGIPVVCTALDQCHLAGVCNPTTGECSNVNAPNGTPCTDGDSCTADESCQAGTCTGGANICGPKDPPTTTTVSCNPSTATRGPVPTDVQTQCTAEVRDAVALGPFATGTVSFFADGAVTPFATCTINGSAQVQTCSVIYRTSAAGAHPIVATYGGDATHTMSTGATVFTVTVRMAWLAIPPTGPASTPHADPPLIAAALALPGRRSALYLEGRSPPRRVRHG